MGTTTSTLREWLEDAPEEATHMLVICDTFDWDDYPKYISGGTEEAKQCEADYLSGKHSMQKLMEIYNLSMGFDAQLDEYRAFNY